jgi:hypothetical protein
VYEFREESRSVYIIYSSNLPINVQKAVLAQVYVTSLSKWEQGLHILC